MSANPSEQLNKAQYWALHGAFLALFLTLALDYFAWRVILEEAHVGLPLFNTLLMSTGLLASLLIAGLAAMLMYTRQLAPRMIQEFKETQQRTEACWEQAVAGLNSGLTDWNLLTGETRYSRHWHEMLGLKEGEVLPHSDEWMKRIHPDDLPKLVAQMNALFEGRLEAPKHEFRMLHADGSWRWILGHAIIHRRDETGRPLRLIGTNVDITERKKTDEELQLAALVYKNGSEAMSVTGSDGRVITVNPAFTQITGYSLEEMQGRHARIFDLDETVFNTVRDTINTAGKWHGEVWSRRKDGDVFPADVSINTIFDEAGQPSRYVALFTDITDRKQTEELVWRQANFDALTQLFNRSMFHERVGQEIRLAQRSGAQLALLFIDLDRFKEINDTLGHDVGDHLLLEAARRIVSCVRETDAVARLGGDEFTVLLAGLSENDGPVIERVARNILENLADPFRLGHEEVYVSASIGITLFPNDAKEIEVLFRNADQAMYLSKSLGRNRYSYFTPALQANAQNRLRLINDLRTALTENQLSLHFQPIVELSTGRLIKAEALLRWHHPQRGMIPPDTFIPLAEETGLIHEIGDWVFHEATRWLHHWRNTCQPELQITINKSPIQFHKDGNGYHAWTEHLKKLGLPGHSLIIEITEGLLLNTDSHVVTELLACRDLGIQVAIDDFGTGYSSLAYLNRLDIDYLKIDRYFIRNLSPGSSDTALSEAIAVMAHKLGLKVIAEGVETQAQRDILTAIGCDQAQGYLFSRPLPPEEFEYLLKKNASLG